MRYTVDEKVKYNRKRNTDFGTGYVFGVNIYRDYSKVSAKDKATIKELISSARENARNGEQWDKGIMCGVRDAANERKARKGKYPFLLPTHSAEAVLHPARGFLTHVTKRGRT